MTNTTSPTAENITVAEHAPALANYPHARRVGTRLYISGCSSRRPDHTHAGVEHGADGRVRLDIRAQTRGVIENILRVLDAAGAAPHDLVDVTTFLVDMADYAAYNEIYDQFFDAGTGPARTTVAVAALPHPHLLIEIKAVAEIGSGRR